MREIVIRLNPLNHLPIVFDRASAKDGQISGYINGEVRRVGISDYYNHCEPMSGPEAVEVAKMYARQQNIPEDEVRVMARLPKTLPEGVAPQKRVRKLNDANLKLVDTPAPNKEAEQLAHAVQQLHDSETKKPEEKAAEHKATAENPQGAKVEPKQKRRYQKQSEKVRSAKSAAALRRYQEEIAKTVSQASESVLTPVVAGPGVSEEKVKEARLKLAMAMAEIFEKYGVL